MYPDLYRQIFAVQTTQWWGRSRRKLSLDLLRRFGLRQGCRHLDLGCGTGQNLGLLDSLQPSRVVGVDISPIALELAHQAWPQCELVQADVNARLPFTDGSFDVATIFNVLYHTWVEDEAAVLREVRRVLTADGLLLVTEPAFPVLAREVDIVDMAKRRYRLEPFLGIVHAAGFDVLLANHFTSFGAPIILGMKAIKTLLPGKPAPDGSAPDMRAMNPLLNAAFYAVAQAEAAAIKASVPVPFGTTLICVAKPR
jgi:ubiquinone/menaquinone biosynthesis C-methylase UbiE